MATPPTRTITSTIVNRRRPGSRIVPLPRIPAPARDLRRIGRRFDSSGQRLVLDAVRLIRVGAQAFVALGLVGLVIAVAPDDLAVPLEREDMRRDPVEEPAVMSDDDGAAAE